MKDESTSISQANEEREFPQFIGRKWRKNERLTHDHKEDCTNHSRCQLGVLKEVDIPELSVGSVHVKQVMSQLLLNVGHILPMEKW